MSTGYRRSNLSRAPRGRTGAMATIPRAPLKKKPRRPRAMTKVMRAPEAKGCDVFTLLQNSNILTTTSSNGQIIPINLIAPGTGSFNRIGRHIALKSFRCRIPFYCYFRTDAGGAAPTVQAPQFIRCALVWDKQPSGIIPDFQTIFGTTTQDGTETASLLAPLRYDNTGRFRVLKDDVMFVEPPQQSFDSAVGGSAVIVSCDMYVKLTGLKTTFSGQSTPCTIGDISSGALYLVFRANVDTYATAGANGTFVATIPAGATGVINGQSVAFARLRYTDC